MYSYKRIHILLLSGVNIIMMLITLIWQCLFTPTVSIDGLISAANRISSRELPQMRSFVPPMEVITQNGKIRGKILNLSASRQVIAFLGIPYAEPPVGEKRFSAPVPYHHWSDILDATRFGPLCLQNGYLPVWDVWDEGDVKVFKRSPVNKYPHNEDCLTLNVYVPKDHPFISNYSVMVYIHGGSYRMNGGRLYHGEWLASVGKVIVVTFNYRLGALGFLSTGDKYAPGNSGLLDQVLVLKWIQSNIEAFGGNSNSVTIFGNSAGSACVGLHLVSPMTQGLFHKAIAQSGSILGHWAIQKSPRRHAQHLARDLHCTSVKNSKVMVRCLRSIPAKDIIHRGERLYDLKNSLPVWFAPVIDGNFLPHNPEQLILQGQFANVSFMTGVTKDELSVWMSNYRDPSSVAFTAKLMKAYLPDLVNTDTLSDFNRAALNHAVYTEYGIRGYSKRKIYKKKDPDLQTLGELFSDVELKAPTLKLAQLLAQNSSCSIYFYEFSYCSNDDILLQNNSWIGAYHESELHYLFGLPYMNLNNTLRTEEDRIMTDTIINLWSNFANYGNPTPHLEEDSELNFTWIPFQVDKNVYAVIGRNLEMRNGYLPERMTFWNFFIPLFTQFPMKIEGRQYCSFVVFVTLLAIVSFMTIVSAAVIWLLCYGRKQSGVILGNGPTSV